tara:strand:+ start:23 stop:172 length:150 start_codon:yes stop_codon:yes gene_type:complete
MFCILIQDPEYRIFTNEIWRKEKEALDYAHRNKLKVPYKVVKYNKIYFK